MQSSSTPTRIDWSDNRLIPEFQRPEHLEIYDLRELSSDAQLSIAALTGLINRTRPLAYLVSRDDDLSWLQKVFGHIPQRTPHLFAITGLEYLVTQHREFLKGMVIYDPGFVDSINIASTIAGQQDALVVSPAQAHHFAQGPYNLPVLTDLRTMHWSSRLEAYHWAEQNLLEQANTQLVAGLDPKIGVGIRPFLVATRTFIYWLDSRDFLPSPTHNWLSEKALMQQILRHYPAGATHLGWFIDEGSGVNLTTKAALPVLASDYFNNLEVWTAVQPETVVVASNAETSANGATPDAQSVQSSPVEDVREASTQAAHPHGMALIRPEEEAQSDIFVSFTISDGDNLQYSQHRMAQLWQDGARGTVPIGWTISPVLAQAAPAMANFYTRTASANDEFIAGPSGAGYMFPSHWPEAELGSFLQRTGKLMQSMNINLLAALDTDFLRGIGLGLISSIAGGDMSFTDEQVQKRYIQALVPFGLKGMLSGAGCRTPSRTVTEALPIYRNLGLVGSVGQTVEFIKHAVEAAKQRPVYLNVYVLAWNMGPSDIKKVALQLGPGYTFVKPGELLGRIGAQTIRV